MDVFFFWVGVVFSQNEGCFNDFAVENKMDMVEGSIFVRLMD